jgi:hypothetical protein
MLEILHHNFCKKKKSAHLSFPVTALGVRLKSHCEVRDTFILGPGLQLMEVGCCGGLTLPHSVLRRWGFLRHGACSSPVYC